MLFLLLLIVLFLVYGFVEYYLHRQRIARIPIRIQVNGTRGKSSVTRLIAAGLRAAGMRVIAKTTGTTPRFITSDTEEVPIARPGKANIIENVKIVRQAMAYDPQVIVLECMALVPQYQWTDAHRLIRPTHGVVTNARADHLDVMGPTVRDVAKALTNTIPDKALFFTAEQEYLPIFADKARRLGTECLQARGDTVSEEDMKGFTYVEHKENVALALLVCEKLNVDRKTALTGMYRTLPDPGALRVFDIRDGGKRMEVFNTLAANDPDSIHILWQQLVLSNGPEIGGRRWAKSAPPPSPARRQRIVLVNCRSDRNDRTRQLAELCAASLEADYYVATGGMVGIFVRTAISHGLPREKVLGFGDNWAPEKVYKGVLNLVRNDAMIFATGNIVGYGDEVIQYFASKAK
jgi:poly-gamma-glutamate synthase PgsB/CapB